MLRPALCSVLTFGLVALLRLPLTPGAAFTSMALFQVRHTGWACIPDHLSHLLAIAEWIPVS